MGFSFVLTTVAATIGFFTLFRKFIFHQENKDGESSSSLASSLSPSSAPASSCRNWTHHVFPSFHGADVRKAFLSHILKEFRSKGIEPFIDNDMNRSKSIGFELIEAIRGSKISIVVLSRNYASSTWCLNELVEIMKCREELGQIVMTVFYEVDPTDVKKQTGDFGNVFQKTCVGKTEESIRKWRHALFEVAIIAGEHSCKWDTEAAMIEKITTDVSNKLNNFSPSSDFDVLVGMGAHMKNMGKLLQLDLDEVRMIGIWGPSGIGKTTIARFLYNQLFNNFQLSVFMESIKSIYTRPACSDDYNEKLQLQQLFMSQITNQKDIVIPHLGVVQERLKDKKVLVVLDDVDRLVQLDAMAKETRWFGLKSRVIITTQDLKLLKAHGINHIYKVDFPPPDEALQIFCVYAFGQKYPYKGFENLAREVTKISGKLPLGLRVMGSYFRGMSKQEWTKSLPRLRASLDADIQSVLKFSYDALCEKDKDLFLHIACFFNKEKIKTLEDYLAEKFVDVRQGLYILSEKSLISMKWEMIEMHNLLRQLGREIVRKQSIHEPGKRQFLGYAREICEVLTDDSGSRSLIGIDLHLSELNDKLYITEKAFKRMPNLQFLRFYYRFGDRTRRLYFPQGLNYLSPKLRLLHWQYFPMTCLPSTFNPEFLVELYMRGSNLEKLWEGVRLLKNIKVLDLRHSINLKELPDFSTATNLQKLELSYCPSLMEIPSSIGKATSLKKINLSNCYNLVELPFSIGNLTTLKELDMGGCSSLVELPFSIGNATNLMKLCLSECSSLVKLPFTIGNATNLWTLDLHGCSSLVELPVSIGNLHMLSKLNLRGCSKLEVLPTNINMKSLNELDITNCSSLKIFPEISTNIWCIRLSGTAIEEVPLSIKAWSRLRDLHISYTEKLEEFPHVLDSITVLHLSNMEIEEVPPWVKKISHLRRLVVNGCKKLVSIPQLQDSLSYLDAENCESLERLDCSFYNPDICLNFANCFKLNQEARDLILHTPTSGHAILPGVEVPACFTYRATGGSLIIKLNQRPNSTHLIFTACIVLVNDDENAEYMSEPTLVSSHIIEQQDGRTVPSRPRERFLPPRLREHLYTFQVEEIVTTTELVLKLKVHKQGWEIGECGVLELFEVSHIDEHDESFRSDDGGFEIK